MPFRRNVNFQGREEELKQLESIDKYSGNIAVIHGLGGIGKTELVTEFVFRSYEAFTAVLWIPAVTAETVAAEFTRIVQRLVNLHVSKTSGQPDITDIARKLGIWGLIDDNGRLSSDDADVSSKEFVDAVLRWMGENPNWLLIFDNLDDIESFQVPAYFPPEPKGMTIITSRRREALTDLRTHSIEIQGLAEEDAIRLLLGKLGKTPELVNITGKLAVVDVVKSS